MSRMRLLLKTCLIGFGAMALALIAGFAWLSYDSRGLPNTQAIAQFGPASVTQVSDSCVKSASVAVPYNAIGGRQKG
jgi:hypothetical protein